MNYITFEQNGKKFYVIAVVSTGRLTAFTQRREMAKQFDKATFDNVVIYYATIGSSLERKYTWGE